jgi:hypothetical protein
MLMRTTASIGALAAALLCSAGVGGCHQLEYHFGPVRYAHNEPAPRKVVRKAKLRRTAAQQLVKPGFVPAGEKIRNFCGQRHVRFQSGTLNESESERVRNNELCREVYTE